MFWVFAIFMAAMLLLLVATTSMHDETHRTTCEAVPGHVYVDGRNGRYCVHGVRSE